MLITNDSGPHGWIISELTLHVYVSIETGTLDLIVACLDHNRAIGNIGLHIDIFHHGRPEFIMMIICVVHCIT